MPAPPAVDTPELDSLYTKADAEVC